MLLKPQIDRCYSRRERERDDEIRKSGGSLLRSPRTWSLGDYSRLSNRMFDSNLMDLNFQVINMMIVYSEQTKQCLRIFDGLVKYLIWTLKLSFTYKSRSSPRPHSDLTKSQIGHSIGQARIPPRLRLLQARLLVDNSAIHSI